MNIKLLPKKLIKPSDICLSGKVYSRDILPQDYINEKCVKKCYVDINNHRRGYCLASSQKYPFRSQYLYSEIIQDYGKINENKQWLSNSSDLNKEQTIDYIFTSGENHYLQGVNIVRRVGLEGKIGKRCPSPKEIVIEHLPKKKKGPFLKWERFSDNIVLEPMSCLDIRSLSFNNTTELSTGFRLKILSWYPGEEKNMLTGLFRVEFISTPGDKIYLEEISTPDPEFVYVLEKDNEDLVSDSIDSIREYLPKTVSTFLTTYDGRVVDVTDYEKVKLDVILDHEDIKNIELISKEDTLIYINNTSNKGLLVVEGDRPFSMYDDINNKQKELSLDKENSILLYTHEDYYSVKIV